MYIYIYIALTSKAIQIKECNFQIIIMNYLSKHFLNHKNSLM